MKALRWLHPGLKIKRWLFLIAVGVFLASVGAAVLLGVRAAPLLADLNEWAYLVTGRLVSQTVYALAFAVLGLAAIAFGLRQMVRSITAAISPRDHGRLAEALYRTRGPTPEHRFVVIGGGTGLSTLLRGLKKLPADITALVTVADDGGSSGRLRREMGMPPPGDIRSCLVALADAEPLMQQLFQYRFRGEDKNGLNGHSFGNLLIAALTDIMGDFERAVKESSKVLAIHGRVLPSTLENVVLRAELEDGQIIEGESRISQTIVPIRRISLHPENPEPLAEALEAIADATAIVIGPGSVFTSIIPNLLIRGLVAAIAASPATKIYVCNVMTQPSETTGFSASDHVEAILRHTGVNFIDSVLLNATAPARSVLAAYRREGAAMVEPDLAAVAALGVCPVSADLLSHTDLARHDPDKLAQAVWRLVNPAGVHARAHVKA